MDPIPSNQPATDVTKMSAPGAGSTPDVDPLVNTWFSRVKAGEKHWKKLYERMRHSRKLVRGIDDEADAKQSKYNKHRANLIASTITVVLSKVYAKNPEMSAEPTNKARDLRLFADTVGTVTQTMLESAKLKAKAKACVRAAMTCSFGVVKVQYQRVTQGETDPIIRARIADSQDNIQRLQALIAQTEDDQARGDAEAQKRELEEVVKGLQAQSEVVAAEGLVIDRVSSDRLVVDPSVEDFWEYETADWMAEKIPMRKSAAKGKFPDLDLSTATVYKAGENDRDPSARRGMYSPMQAPTADDVLVMVWEIWSRADNRIYTIVEGCNKQFAVPPYTPKVCGERWWPYFILPFQSVDGEFSAQSLVDTLERLQDEHNETRDKFAEVRRKNRPYFIGSGDLKEKTIRVMVHPELGEIVVADTHGVPIGQMLQQAPQLIIDPQVYDTGPIRYDWEQVSGLQDAARSTVVQPKTATEAAISDQSLSARVSEFRDQIEDWLTDIAQYSSELCLLAMTPQMVETIMGSPQQVSPEDEQAALEAGQPPKPPEPTYEWPGANGWPQAAPQNVFNLVQIKIRAGSTASPNKLQAQDNWNKALQILMPMIDKIRMVEGAGGDATPERELVKETAARFDETIDVERFLPLKPPPRPVVPAVPGLPGGAMPHPGMPALPGNDPAAAMPHMAGGAPLQ